MRKRYRKSSKSTPQNKRDGYTARPIVLAEVAEALELRGFRDVKLHQIWRNVHGTVVKDDTKYFFKMASTVGISRGARNEVRWNNYFNKVLTKAQRRILTVPKVATTGYIERCFFYVSDFIDAKPLADQSKRVKPKDLSPWVGDIVKAWRVLDSVEPTRFVWDSIYSRLRNPGKRFFRRAEFFYSKTESPEFLPLLDRAREIVHTYAPALNHGDMTPWHFIPRDDKSLCLIDAEQASSMLPKYYDIAYFFHRLATMGDALDLAREFLARYRDQLPKKSQIDFDKKLPPIVAERTLGGFWDVTQGGNHATGRDIRPYRAVMACCLKDDLY